MQARDTVTARKEGFAISHGAIAGGLAWPFTEFAGAMSAPELVKHLLGMLDLPEAAPTVEVEF